MDPNDNERVPTHGHDTPEDSERRRLADQEKAAEAACLQSAVATQHGLAGAATGGDMGGSASPFHFKEPPLFTNTVRFARHGGGASTAPASILKTATAVQQELEAGGSAAVSTASSMTSGKSTESISSSDSYLEPANTQLRAFASAKVKQGQARAPEVAAELLAAAPRTAPEAPKADPLDRVPPPRLNFAPSPRPVQDTESRRLSEFKISLREVFLGKINIGNLDEL